MKRQVKALNTKGSWDHTSHPEAGAAYSSDSSRASGSSLLSHMAGQQYFSPALSMVSFSGQDAVLQDAKGPPLMPCTKTTSIDGDPAVHSLVTSETCRQCHKAFFPADMPINSAADSLALQMLYISNFLYFAYHILQGNAGHHYKTEMHRKETFLSQIWD